MLLNILDLLDQFYNWLLPRICVGCGFNSENAALELCAGCRPRLPWINNRCYQCGAQIVLKTESVYCEKCQASPPPYDRLCALFLYQAPIPKLINNLKFGEQLYLGRVFGQLLTERICGEWYKELSLPEVIIPMPLHYTRLRQRGYNQALEIAKPIARALNIPLDLQLCQRVKNTKAQARLKRAARVRNLVAAFTVEPKKCIYKHIAIVDDVVTTGSTVRALSRSLLAAGVEQIDIWCVCRG